MVSHFRNYENVKLSHFDVFGNSQKVEVSTIHEHDLFSSFRFHPCIFFHDHGYSIPRVARYGQDSRPEHESSAFTSLDPTVGADRLWFVRVERQRSARQAALLFVSLVRRPFAAACAGPALVNELRER